MQFSVVNNTYLLTCSSKRRSKHHRNFELDDELLPDPNAFSRAQRRRAESVFDRACEISDDYGKEIEPLVRSGEAVKEIMNYAEAHAIDHIIIGHHESPELLPLFRTVSESVTRKASMPVTVVC